MRCLAICSISHGVCGGGAVWFTDRCKQLAKRQGIVCLLFSPSMSSSGSSSSSSSSSSVYIYIYIHMCVWV